MDSPLVTFVVFTFNEEDRIERVIRNLLPYGKILLADDGSTDKTHSIATAYGCDIYIREKKYTFVENQELVDKLYQQVKTDWIYWAFSDEMLSKETLDKILSIVKSGQYDIINIDRKNYNQGEFCFDLFHSRTNRVFKKHSIDFSNNMIHGMGVETVPKNRVYRLDNRYFIHHFTSHTIDKYLSTLSRYSESEMLKTYRVNTSLVWSLSRLFRYLLKGYFFDKGYKAGFQGLQVILLHVCYEWVVNMRHFENNNGLTSSAIDRKYNDIKDKILSDIQ